METCQDPDGTCGSYSPWPGVSTRTPCPWAQEPHWSSPQGYIVPVPILTCKLTSWPNFDLAPSLWTCPVTTRPCLTLARPDRILVVCLPILILPLQHHHGCAWWSGVWDDASCHIWMCPACHTWWLSEIFFRCRIWKSMLFWHFNRNFAKIEWTRRTFF